MLESYPLPALAGIAACGVGLIALLAWAVVRSARAETPHDMRSVRLIGRVVGLPLFLVMGALVAAFWR